MNGLAMYSTFDLEKSSLPASPNTQSFHDLYQDWPMVRNHDSRMLRPLYRLLQYSTEESPA